MAEDYLLRTRLPLNAPAALTYLQEGAVMQRIEDCVSYLVGKAAQTIYRATRDALARYGITPVQYAVLQILWESDGPTGAEICNRLILDSATITGVLDRLEKLELVQRMPDPEDRRVNRIHLTRKGKAHRDPLQRQMDRLNKDIAESLGGDAPRVWKALRRLAAYGVDDADSASKATSVRAARTARTSN